jgi:hypothetical protein
MGIFSGDCPFSFLQWKSAPKSKLMDSKLRCVFVEGEPTEAAEQESTPETPEKVRPY